MCELLLSSLIVGAFEFAPGSMRIEYLEPGNYTSVPSVAFVYTDHYLECMEHNPEL